MTKRRRVTATMKKQQKKFKAAAKHCKATGQLGKKYRSCMSKQLKK